MLAKSGPLTLDGAIAALAARQHGVVATRQLVTAGYRTLRFTDRQLENDPHTVAATIGALLADRRAA